MSRARIAGALVVAVLLAVAGVARAGTRIGRFPHAAHAGLFPTCVGCHAGIPNDSGAARFPAPASCAGCHDGSALPRVEWQGAEPEPSNLRFSHARHSRRVVADSQQAGAGGTGDPSLQCGACHRLAGDSRFLAVARARPATCLGCHAHAAPSHLDDRSDCRGCHLPLASATRLTAERIADFPRPPSHDAPDFVRRHAPRDGDDIARCATCHAQQSCARCHVDARTNRTIAAIPPDARVARLVAGRAGQWPLPPSHARRDWVYEHGRDAERGAASCGSCHAQPSCRACHIGSGAAKVIRRLPAPGEGVSPGVQLRGVRDARLVSHAPRRDGRAHAPATPADVVAAIPARSHDATTAPTATTAANGDGARVHVSRVHGPGYERAHGTEASAHQLDCAGCHTQRYCADCHAGETRRRFHGANFVQRHAPEAWGRQQDCASCHNPEAFCRTCHVSAGLASQGGLSSAYHTRQPVWLLQHGQAARQGLESCTSCHQQSDCLQCHSQLGAFRVNPHGPGFDARRAQERNAAACQLCHIGNPIR